VEFVALYRPYRDGQQPPREEKLKKIDGGYVLTADLTDGQVVALLPTDGSVVATLQLDE
jgi:hypothetical protein